MEKRWADIVGNDIGTDEFFASRGHIFKRKPRPVNELIFFKFVMNVLKSEVRLHRAIIGQNYILGTASLFAGNRSLEQQDFPDAA